MIPPEPQTSFASLVDRHSRFLYRVAFSLTGNRQDAEDTVQETFMKLVRTNASRPHWQEGIADERAYLAPPPSRASQAAQQTPRHSLPPQPPVKEQKVVEFASAA